MHDVLIPIQIPAAWNSRKSERLLRVASEHSNNTFALTFDPTTG